MAKPTGMQPKVDELRRLTGEHAAANAPKGASAAKRKRPDEELVAPDSAATALENLPDQSVEFDQLPAQRLNAAVAGEEAVTTDSAQDAYSSVESDAWLIDGTPAGAYEERIELAQAGGGSGGTGGTEGDGDKGAFGLTALLLGVGALALIAGGGDSGGDEVGGTTGGGATEFDFDDINPELSGVGPTVFSSSTTSAGLAHTFSIGSIAGVGLNEGFSRSLLPADLAALAPSMVYDMVIKTPMAPTTTTIDYHGLQVDVAASDAQPINIFVSASASSGESHLLWLANAGVAAASAANGFAAQITAHAAASGTNADAQVGISNFNIDLTGAGPAGVAASASLDAFAAGTGARAAAFVGNGMSLAVDAFSAQAHVHNMSAAAVAGAAARVGVGGIISVHADGVASADAGIQRIGASATYDATAAAVAGGVDVYAHVSAASADARAYQGNIYAHAYMSSEAQVLIGGDVDVSAEGINSANATIDSINATAITDSFARVEVVGAVSGTAVAQGFASASVGGIFVHAEGLINSSYSAIPGYGSTAEVVIGGGVQAHAGGTTSYAAAYTIFTSTTHYYSAETTYTDVRSAFASVGSMSASAVVSSDAHLSIGGPVSATALGGELAVAQVGDFEVFGAGGQSYSYAVGFVGIPGSGSRAEMTIAGGVNAYASATAGEAYAYVEGMWVGAFADSYARIDIGGDVSATAVGDTFAGAYVGAISASASGDSYITASVTASGTYYNEVPIAGGTASISIDGGVHAYADGRGVTTSYAAAYTIFTSATHYYAATTTYTTVGGASAYVYRIFAEADTSSTARVEIDGDVTAIAYGATTALAHVGVDGSNDYGITASASESSTARVDIYGDVRAAAAAVYATGTSVSADLAGQASAFVDEIYAEASSHSLAQVNVTGDVLASAEGGAFAQAFIGTVGASASETATAQVLIGGDIGVAAFAADGNAYAYIDNVSVTAQTNSVARVDIDGNVLAIAITGGGGAMAQASIGSISASASETSTGDVLIGGAYGVGVMAIAEGGAAYASIGDIAASATSDNANALVGIDSDVLLLAVGATFAEAYVGSMRATATQSSTADVSIGGNFDVLAIAEGAAHAYVGGIRAEASDSAATASVVVHGTATGGFSSLPLPLPLTVAPTLVAAYAASGNAMAHIGYGYVSTSGTSSNLIYAYGISASAHDGALSYDAVANVSLGDVYVIAGAGSGSADAYIQVVSAYASEYASANVALGQVNVYASAETGNAAAFIGGVQAHAGEDASAQVTINGSVLVQAEGSNGAEVYVGEIGAIADERDGDAQVSIDGNVSISAAASGEVFAHLGNLHAHVSYSAQSADAAVDMGNLSVRARSANNAYAYIDSIHADAAGSESATASVSAGNVLVQADGSNTAFASIGRYDDAIRANASDEGAEANVYLGNVTVTAAAVTGSGDAVADRAVAYMSNIGAHASASGAEALVSMDDLTVGAIGARSAQAHLGNTFSNTSNPYATGITAAATIYADANVNVFGSVHVYATATTDVGYGSDRAQATIGQIGAFAQPTDSQAGVYISDEVSVRAEGEDFADAHITRIVASASGSFSNQASAEVEIDGGVHVFASAASSSAPHFHQHIAYAYVSDIAANADNGGYAHVTIGEDSAPDDAVSITAIGEDRAIAFGMVHAYAASESADAVVVIDGDMSIYASATVGDAFGMFVLHAGVVATAFSTQGFITGFNTGGGHVQVNGDAYVYVTASDESAAYGQIVAAGSGSINITGDVDIAVGGDGDLWLDIFASSNASVDIGGDINVYVGNGASAYVYVQQTFSAAPVADFVTHGSGSGDVDFGGLNVNVDGSGHASIYMGANGINESIGWELDRTADLDGTGGVYMRLEDQVFGTIDLTGLTGFVELDFNLGDEDYATVGAGTSDAHITRITGFSGEGVGIQFNNTDATAQNATTHNFASIASFTDFAAWIAPSGALDTALNGTDKYVFAVYQGLLDINGDAVADTGSGVLAYDQDGNGITAVLLLPGVIELTPGDLANGV